MLTPAAGVPMAPVIRGDTHTRRQIVCYSVVLVLASLLPVAIGAAPGRLYLLAALVPGGLLGCELRLAWQRTLSAARALFWVSHYYLALLFAAMVLDRVLR